MTQKALWDADQTGRVRCDRCGSDQFSDVPIHEGRSMRRDCAWCGRTLGFPIWREETTPSASTKVTAAAAIAPLKESMECQVLKFVVGRGDYGATDHEIRSALAMLGDTARARRRDLVKAGVLAASRAHVRRRRAAQ